AVAQGSCVGGSTVVNDAVCFRTPEPVLETWRAANKIEEIGPEAMAPYFDRVERRISVSEVQPHELNRNNLVLKRGADKLGWAHGPNKRNCKTCRLCGNCQIGCFYGTKQSMLETYISEAERDYSDKFKVYADTQATDLVRSGARVTGVRAVVTGAQGKTFDLAVKAKVVVVAGGTIASSQLLLESGIDVAGQVGKGVAIHPSPAMVGDFEEEINGNQGIPMAYHCHEFSVLKTGEPGFMLEAVFFAPYQFSLPLPGVGLEHKELMSRYSHYALVGSLLQDESVGTVMAGGPLAYYLDYELSAKDSEKMLEGMKASAKVLFAAGATRVITSHRRRTVLHGERDLHLIDDRGASSGSLSVGSGHPQGGNRMGGVRGSAVVDSHSKVYGLENLFVCDASVFPTSIGVNPQVTVMALAARASDHIGENWQRYSGGT
ncbi:MAG TPA: GMC family oxidoreductase, partial [Nitrososphaerales archaeon]|nr:GMC family oxidoreductase [Nitrososphaerales archaeon]